MQFSTFAAAALMASAANAHMIMKTPTPFNAPNNSPLDASGSDFPCKGPPTTKTSNTFQAGQNQTLSFTGTAVHGGGSCQLSVTLDTSPTKSSKFKVIHSIEGGCPGVNGPAEFSFPVSSAIPNGEATFAWTWFNHIGNREMYMNCASITVSGGASDSSEFDKLPDMAVANIAASTGTSCKTTESFDYTFADPGTSVQVVGSGPFKELCGGAANVGGGSGGGSGASSGPASGASSTAAANNGQYTPTQAATSAAATTQAPAASSTAAGGGGVFAPGASSADPVTSTVSTLLTVTSPTAAPTGSGNTTVPTQPAAQPAQPSSTGTPATGGTSCSTNGAVVCNGETQFGLCDNGKVVWMAVAAGTKCSNGQISKREFVHRARVRRSVY